MQLSCNNNCLCYTVCMSHTRTEEQILETLRSTGHRITLSRRAIIRAVLKSSTPLSAAGVLEKIRKDKTEVDKTTVYRELQMLADADLIRSMTFDDGIRRYQAHADSHTHHIVCTKCNKVDDVTMEHDMDAVEKSILKKKDFTVTSHSLEFYGLCAKCA